MKLIPQELLIKTNQVDHADWNYRPFLGRIMRLRFWQIKSLMQKDHYHRLLEIGYGSGIFLPELRDYCDELYGIDIHDRSAEVQKILERIEIDAKVFRCNAEQIIFMDNYFDCVVAISTLEFIEDIETASKEIIRVLKHDGCLIIVTPGHAKVLDIELKLLTGESAKRDYGDRREKLVPSLQKYFSIEKQRNSPGLIGWFIPLYKGYRLSPNQQDKYPRSVDIENH